MRNGMLRGTRPWAVAALAFGLVVSGGCLGLGDDDDVPGGDPGENLDSEVAWGTAGNAVDATSSIVANLGHWVQHGIEATGRAQSVSWNPSTGEWTVSGSEDYDDGDATGSVEYTYVVRFSADGVTQEQPDDDTDRVDVELDVTNEGSYHPATETWTIDYDWTAHEEAVATALPEGGGALVGSGSLSGETVAHVGEASIPDSQQMTWDADLVLPDQSCATGTVTGEMDDWTFVATMDGTDEMVMSLFHRGSLVDSDTQEAPCGEGSGE